MVYAEVAINAPIRQTFSYHIPLPLDGKIRPGHLVRVSFGTAMQPGIVLALSNISPIEHTKPIEARLDPQPVMTPLQIDVARRISEMYLAPIGMCLWLFLPPGIAGQSDTVMSLRQPDVVCDDELEQKIIALLKRRGALRVQKIKQSIKDAKLEKTLKKLVTEEILDAEPVLTAPRVRPKVIQTAALNIHPVTIPEVTRLLGHKSRRADLLEAVADLTQEQAAAPVQDVLAAASSTRATLKRLADEERLVTLDGQYVSLNIPHDAVDSQLIRLRRAQLDVAILRVLGRETEPLDVSWVFAQTGATLDELKRLEELDLITLGEKQVWRDSLTDRDFVPVSAPKLVLEQESVWAVIRGAFGGEHENPTPYPLPVNGEGTESSSDDDSEHVRNSQKAMPDKKALMQDRRGTQTWYTPPQLWEKLKDLAREKRHEPTKAEAKLWDYLKNKQLEGHVFRRQHAIDRFIVDLYCRQAGLIVEVDGEIHQYTQEEDAIRQEFLESQGFRVLRFTNDEVLHHVTSVLRRILETIKANPNPLPSEAVDGEGTESSSDSDSENVQSSPILARTSKEQEISSRTPVDSPPPFTGEVGRGSPSSKKFLLHGVTGSGKTELYLSAIETALSQGRQAIFLVPEIALTAQTLRRVAARFPGKVAILHSRLTEGERYDTWRRAREGLIQVVVGARSALFTPLPDIGVIILDEEHDASFKSQSHPVYDTRFVAEEMARLNNAVLILGSATPDVITYYRAQRGDLTYLHLPNRIMGHRIRIEEQAEREGVAAVYHAQAESDALSIDLPPVHLIDMREELQSGNTGIFSRALQDALTETLKRREQAILFLNRRGKSTYVFCRDCGYISKCPRCDTPMTYHEEDGTMHCHHCNYHSKTPVNCPQCKSRRIKFFGAGTQQVEIEFKKLFPKARVVRWDADTASNPAMHDTILQRFMSHEADVMVGTQMIAKGLDLPLVTLVGVVSADTGLALPDFRACERTFQLLTQVAGRAGRGLLGGQVILQTYQPGNYAIVAASNHDYETFYAKEITYRRELGYPPFRRLAQVLIQNENAVRAKDEATRAATMLRKRVQDMQMTGTEIIGPAPCFFSRLNRVYRWHVLVRSPNPNAVLENLDIGRGWSVEIDPPDVL